MHILQKNIIWMAYFIEKGGFLLKSIRFFCEHKSIECG